MENSSKHNERLTLPANSNNTQSATRGALAETFDDRQKIYLTPSWRHKLRKAFERRYGNIEAFLRDWQQHLQEPLPSEEDAAQMLLTATDAAFARSLVNGACWLLLGYSYRDNSSNKISPALKKVLIERFEEQFQSDGKTSWMLFFVRWQIAVPQYKPPLRQTLQIFFDNPDRDTCEYWMADGLCRLLLGRSYEDWKQNGEGGRQNEGRSQRALESSMHTFSISYPTSLLLTTGKPPEALEDELRFLLAAKLFELRMLSLGKAAELCGMPKVRFIFELGRLKISVINLDEDQIAEELADD